MQYFTSFLYNPATHLCEFSESKVKTGIQRH